MPNPHMTAPDICIIGAGSSGVTVAKALKEAGLTFDIFEAGSDIGGMWRYNNDSGRSSCYASLHIDTSRPNLGYSDFPIDPDLPDFLSHEQFLAHLEAYADRFGIRPLITFNTEVVSVVADDMRWQVQLSDGTTRTYGKVIIANGHLSDPRMPTFAGHFDGEVIHAHHYRTAAPFEGKRVMVVGLGNSAVDIAVDLCRRAKHITLSTRRSAWVMPKYLMGVPVDQWSGFLARKLRLSTPMVRRIMARLVRLGVGDQRRFGLPRPKHPMWREHATLSQELLAYIGHGWITIRPNVKELRGDRVVSGEKIEVWGDGTVTRDYLYVSDLAELCAKAVSGEVEGAVNAGSGKGTTINEIIECISGVTKIDIKPVYLEGRAVDVPLSVLNVEKAAKSFNWRSQTELEHGIKNTWQWLNEKS